MQETLQKVGWPGRPASRSDDRRQRCARRVVERTRVGDDRLDTQLQTARHTRPSVPTLTQDALTGERGEVSPGSEEDGSSGGAVVSGSQTGAICREKRKASGQKQRRGPPTPQGEGSPERARPGHPAASLRGEGTARFTEVRARGLPRAVSKPAHTWAWVPAGRTLSSKVRAGLGTSGLGALRSQDPGWSF